MKINKTYTQALLYCRVSHPNQVSNGDGLRSQSTACKTFIRNQGWNLEKTFWEKGFNGGNDFRTRPAMIMLLQYLDDHLETNYVVVVDDIKRWARATMFHLELKQELAKRNAVMASPKLPFVLDDSPESIYFETCLAAQAQLEGQQNRRQAMTRMHSRMLNGYSVFRAPPGYKYQKVKNNGKCLFFNEKAKIIQKALKGFALGTLSTQRDVGNFLVEHGYQKRKIHSDVVKSILSNILYAGYIERPDWNIPLTKANHEPLISLKTYKKIQARLKKTNLTPRKTDDSNFPMRRKVKCFHCGKTLIGSFFNGRKQKYPFYSCLNSKCVAKPKYIKKEKIELGFHEIIRNAKPSKEIRNGFEMFAKKLYKEFQSRYKDIEKGKQAQIRRYEDRITELVNKALETSSKILEKRYEKEIELLETEIAELSSSTDLQTTPSFENALSELLSFCDSPLEHWKKANVLAKNKLFNIMFSDKLEYSEKGGYRTAPFSRHYYAIEHFGNCDSTMVDYPEKNLNQDFEDFRELLLNWYSVLCG